MLLSEILLTKPATGNINISKVVIFPLNVSDTPENNVFIRFLICRVEHYPEQGKYDLVISKATYDRDNGQYEGRRNERGAGLELHAKSVELTV